MSPSTHRSSPGLAGETILVWFFIIFAVLAVGSVNGAVRLAAKFTGEAYSGPADPFSLFFGVLGGSVPWTRAVTWALVAELVLLAAAAAGAALLLRGFRGKRSRVDSASRYMGRGHDVAALTKKGAETTAKRLGVESALGVPIGRTLGGQMLYGSWEDLHIDIWGPRTGKSSSRAIPAILEAPGAVLVTSNKRDVVDATRGPRSERGSVWVFDPQGVTFEEPSWWWNPLSYVTDEVKAAKLAEHFASGSRDPEAKTDAYFDPAGQELLAGLLLAAALDSRPITDVYVWLTQPANERPVEVLREHGFDLIASQVSGTQTAPDKQRGGIFGTAKQMASCLTSRAVAGWVTPIAAGDARPQFNPHDFVTGQGTIYSLSREGVGTAGPLVTALTVAVVEAAEEIAVLSPGGRLPTPLLGVLDEAANVCRWRNLPDLYSHYGSRGIVLMTILQSWSQGAQVWGQAGMKKLWSAANVKVFGGGVHEDELLRHLSEVIGDYDREVGSVTYGKHRSVSRQHHRERILSPADLAALPRGRAVVLASGARPALIRTVPWMEGPHAEAVRASIAEHEPGARVLNEMALSAAPAVTS